MAYFEYQGKSVYYTEYGKGEPLVFLHGNTASSKMSELLMPLYADKFRCILIDFLGNGQSDRVENDNFSANLLAERKAAKEDIQSRQFYEWCQGADWEKIVDLDTKALLKCAEEKRPLFHKPLERLKTPILFMGSKEDESCRSDIEEEYREMAAMLSQSSVYLFPSGGHPSLFSNAEKTADIIYNFIFQQEE